jgi:hypothetical protein
MNQSLGSCDVTEYVPVPLTVVFRRQEDGLCHMRTQELVHVLLHDIHDQ